MSAPEHSRPTPNARPQDKRRTFLAGAAVVGASLSLGRHTSAQTSESSAPPPGQTAPQQPGQQDGAQHGSHTGNPAQDRLLQPNPAEFKRVTSEFLDGFAPQSEGLTLDVPALADNPSAVPVRVIVTQPITDENWCEEVIIVAEKNPIPLACRLFFTPQAGVAEAAVRIRLARSQTVHAYARMKNGQRLAVKRAITVAASGCGM